MGKVFLTSGSGDGTVKLRTLQIASRPTKTDYKAGELLDLTGLKIVAVWSDGTSDDVTNSCTYVPAEGTPGSGTGTARGSRKDGVTVFRPENFGERLRAFFFLCGKLCN